MHTILDVGTGFCIGVVTGAAALYVYLFEALDRHGKAIAEEIKKELENTKR